MNIRLDEGANRSLLHDPSIPHNMTYPGSGTVHIINRKPRTINYESQIQEAVMQPKLRKNFLKNDKHITPSVYNNI